MYYTLFIFKYTGMKNTYIKINLFLTGSYKENMMGESHELQNTLELMAGKITLTLLYEYS
jgi:hypothetical protein